MSNWKTERGREAQYLPFFEKLLAEELDQMYELYLRGATVPGHNPVLSLRKLYTGGVVHDSDAPEKMAEIFGKVLLRGAEYIRNGDPEAIESYRHPARVQVEAPQVPREKGASKPNKMLDLDWLLADNALSQYVARILEGKANICQEFGNIGRHIANKYGGNNTDDVFGVRQFIQFMKTLNYDLSDLATDLRMFFALKGTSGMSIILGEFDEYIDPKSAESRVPRHARFLSLLTASEGDVARRVILDLISNEGTSWILKVFLAGLDDYYYDSDHPCRVSRALVALDKVGYGLDEFSYHLDQCKFSYLGRMLRERLASDQPLQQMAPPKASATKGFDFGGFNSLASLRREERWALLFSKLTQPQLQVLGHLEMGNPDYRNGILLLRDLLANGKISDNASDREQVRNMFVSAGIPGVFASYAPYH